MHLLERSQGPWENSINYPPSPNPKSPKGAIGNLHDRQTFNKHPYRNSITEKQRSLSNGSVHCTGKKQNRETRASPGTRNQAAYKSCHPPRTAQICPQVPRCTCTHPAERAGAKLLRAAEAAEYKNKTIQLVHRAAEGRHPPSAHHPLRPSLTQATQSQTGQHRVSSSAALPVPVTPVRCGSNKMAFPQRKSRGNLPLQFRYKLSYHQAAVMHSIPTEPRENTTQKRTMGLRKTTTSAQNNNVMRYFSQRPSMFGTSSRGQLNVKSLTDKREVMWDEKKSLLRGFRPRES